MIRVSSFKTCYMVPSKRTIYFSSLTHIKIFETQSLHTIWLTLCSDGREKV